MVTPDSVAAQLSPNFVESNMYFTVWNSTAQFRVKSGKFGQSSKFGQRPCFFYFFLMIGINF